jgi:HSP20 family protein
MVGKKLERQSERSDWWPEVFPRRMLDWLDMPMFGAFREGEHMLRMEELVENGDLVVRAELPGIDPDKDVEVKLHDHTLDIRAERKVEESTEQEGTRRSEFRYGSYFRSIALPPNVKESDVSATYKDGILEVHVPLEKKSEASTKAIPVARK